jgi:hypothetical protein
MTIYTKKFLLGLIFFFIVSVFFISSNKNENATINELHLNLIAEKLNADPSDLIVKFDPFERKSFVTYNHNEYIFQYDSENNRLNLVANK